MDKLPTPAIAGGVLSATLYFASFALGLGFLFLFIPTLPIFWLALSRTDSTGLHASLIATVILALIASPAHAIVYLFLLALPSFYMAHESLRRGQFENNVVWFPLTVIITRLTAIFCFLLLAITLYYAHNEGGLPAMVAERLAEALTVIFAEIPEANSEIIKAAAVNMSFLVFPVTAWMWLLSIYLHGWFINRELVRRNLSIRPNFRIPPFPPQNWLITLLLITAIASIIGGPSLVFWGKASLITLLLSHFLLGLALIHTRAKNLPNISLLLFCLYFLLLMQPWITLVVAAYGAFYHIRLLNKYLSAGGSSSKN